MLPPLTGQRRKRAPEAPLDPLKRVFIPREFKDHFATLDHTVYRRDPTTHVIRRAIPKVRGKWARKADRRLRRVLKEAAAKNVVAQPEAPPAE